MGEAATLRRRLRCGGGYRKRYRFELASGTLAAVAEQSQEQQQTTLTAQIERVTFHNEENGYGVLRVKPKGKRSLVTVVGKVAAPNAGEEIVARGVWHDDEHYGAQFQAEEITTSEPGTLDGIERYLGSGLVEGIGPVYAKKMVEKFGAEVFDIIDNKSKRLEEVEGIGPKRRKEIKESWAKQKTVRQIMVFLHQHGITTARAVRIYKAYGEGSIRLLRADPYRLARDLHGVGFKTADTIAAKLGVDGDSEARVTAGLEHCLNSAVDNGHCALPEDELLGSSADLLGVGGAAVAPMFEKLLEEGRAERDGDLVFPPNLLAAEREVAEWVKVLASVPATHPEIEIPKALAWCEQKIGYALAPGQRAAVEAALRERVLVITGGPGVGKTTIINSVLMVLRAKGVEPVLCAPTGRAAKRLAESTGLEAKTIHRLLEYQGGSAGFARDADNLLEGVLFVADEVSMVDLQLMAAFLRALPDGAHLILVGDVDQLPSVGPGRVLSDLIESGAVPVARLTEIFRQSGESRIIRAAHEINEGRLPPELEEGAPPAKGKDFFFIERDDPEAAAETLVYLVRERLPEAFGLDPLTDIQVLTPMHRGSLGTQVLNRQLQDALNPANEATFEIERFGARFRTGDKVIQLRNNYDKEVFNGDIGIIAEIGTDPGRVLVRFEDGRGAEYEPGELDELAPAYAITVHKSQGSEFPCVVIPVATQQFVLLQRNLLYTAVTRGKRLVVLVGQRKAAAMAVKNVEGRERYRGLLRRLVAT